jgi:hypothetical protein
MPITGESPEPKTESVSLIKGPKELLATSELKTKEVKFWDARIAVVLAPWLGASPRISSVLVSGGIHLPVGLLELSGFRVA